MNHALIKQFKGAVKYVHQLVSMPINLHRINKSLDDLNRRISQTTMLVADNHDALKEQPEPSGKKTAIMTVFILKENILFLEEWISHHLSIGVDHFVLYDNSNSRKPDELPMPLEQSRFEGGKVNRHNIDYGAIVASRLSDQEIDEEFKRIREKFSKELTVVPWEPRDETGVICYAQAAAIKDFVQRYRQQFAYGIHIDIDEFLISEEGMRVQALTRYMEARNISSGYLSQRRFLYRFSSLDTQVREIPYCINQDFATNDTNAPKTIFRMSLFQSIDDPISIHFIPTLLAGRHIEPNIMRFNHYQWPSLPGKTSLKDLTEDDRDFLRREFVVDQSIFKYFKQGN